MMRSKSGATPSPLSKICNSVPVKAILITEISRPALPQKEDVDHRVNICSMVYKQIRQNLSYSDFRRF